MPSNAESPHPMTKKWKRSSDVPAAATVEKTDDSAPQQPERTLFGFRDQPDSAVEPVSKDVGPFFRNKEKVLITCSRLIIYRYGHLMQNVVSLLLHAKKNSKVESKQSKGSALNELVELRSCSRPPAASFLRQTMERMVLCSQIYELLFPSDENTAAVHRLRDHDSTKSIMIEALASIEKLACKLCYIGMKLEKRLWTKKANF